MEARILLREVERLTLLSKARSYSQLQMRAFAMPLKLGPRAVAWLADELHEWLSRRPHATGDMPRRGHASGFPFLRASDVRVAVFVLAQAQFGMRNVTGGDIKDVKVEHIDRRFVLGAGGGVRIEFAFSNQMLGKASNEDLTNSIRVLLSDD